MPAKHFIETNTLPFHLEPSWQEALQHELAQPYMAELAAFLRQERAGQVPIYPPEELVFEAFAKTPFNKVRVVLVGQDPYHGPGQAQGLCFSVPHGMRLPPSLKNIFKELQADLGIPPASHGCLTPWAEQGVLLLNVTLTLREGEPLSHHGKGWERFTDAVIQALLARAEPVIFVLWGKSAQAKFCHLSAAGGAKHACLMAPHPSPFSAYQGFFGCRHFSKINELLKQRGLAPIDWQLT